MLTLQCALPDPSLIVPERRTIPQAIDPSPINPRRGAIVPVANAI
jgi:hypothetical protein